MVSYRHLLGDQWLGQKSIVLKSIPYQLYVVLAIEFVIVSFVVWYSELVLIISGIAQLKLIEWSKHHVFLA